MSRHPVADACFGVVLILAAWEAMLMGYGNVELLYLFGSFMHVPSLVVPFTLLILFANVACLQLLRSGVRWWAYLGLLLPTVWIMFFSGSWFTTGFHDLAEHYFGSHGRFGCEDGNTYIFRDTTAPWILHGPVLVAVLAHWLHRSPVVWTWLHSLIKWSTTYEPRKTSLRSWIRH